ncbi:MAG TPA: universal stress protein [Saprospiraceae bacterium]|nr:universal stress protein [Saprospiraceae bacterium]HMQ82213.1 universal stress protein [Saprospiraceae bacterium]
MPKLLFTTAYSEHSKFIWQYALQLAAHLQASIDVLHIANDHNHVSFESPINQAEKLQIFIASNTPESFKQIPVHYILKSGEPAGVILKQEEQSHYDVLFMGATTSNLFPDKFIGSVSLKVLEMSSCPVLLVPPISEFRAIKRIVYATNFDNMDEWAIRQLCRWSNAYQAEICLLHVVEESAEDKKARKKMDKLLNLFQKNEHQTTIYAEIESGEKDELIVEYLEQHPSDMLAFTTHRKDMITHLFKPSLTKKVVAKSNTPVLVFKNLTE